MQPRPLQGSRYPHKHQGLSSLHPHHLQPRPQCSNQYLHLNHSDHLCLLHRDSLQPCRLQLHPLQQVGFHTIHNIMLRNHTCTRHHHLRVSLTCYIPITN